MFATTFQVEKGLLPSLVVEVEDRPELICCDFERFCNADLERMQTFAVKNSTNRDDSFILALDSDSHATSSHRAKPVFCVFRVLNQE